MTNLIGKTAPQLILDNATGEPLDLQSHRGSPVLVVFLRHLG